MKGIIYMVLLTLWARCCPAQNLQEWLQQNATQQRYLIEQIAQLKIYLELAEKGYQVASEGLSLISDFKNGEFNLHKNRLDSLAIVKPAIKNSTKANDIVGLVKAAIVFYWQLDDILRKEKHLSEAEKGYIKGVFDRLAWQTQDLLTQREVILKSGLLSMTDDARVDQLGKLYLKASENYRFARQVLESAGVLAAQRQREMSQLHNSRILYGIK